MKENNSKFLEGNPYIVYLSNVFPILIGLLTISSAGLVDAFFVGNYVGMKALAAVNLSSPLINFMVGFSVMLVVGASVKAGKYLGEKNTKKANEIFSKAFLLLAVINILISLFANLFIENILNLLGTNKDLYFLTKEYASIILLAPLFLSTTFLLFYFVRLDGRATFASIGISLTAIINICLDWYLIYKLQLGIKGAAIATTLSYLVGSLFLLSHFFSSKANFKFTFNIKNWKEIFLACYNGISEFFNEISAGIIILVFNHMMIKYLDVDGVVAFTIINHMLLVEIIILFAFADAMQLIISVNYGAKKFDRIKTFVNIGRFFALLIGILATLIITNFSGFLISLFLQDGNPKVMKIASDFASIFWIAFIFNGFNMITSSYNTAMQNPKASLIIAISRSLILPVGFLFILPIFLNELGIYIALPLAEIITFLIALALYMKYHPSKYKESSLS